MARNTESITGLHARRQAKRIFSLSGIDITDQVCPRDKKWLEWMDQNGASSNSIRKFLELYPLKNQ